jgi:long-chain fatty acid transport protein
MGIPTVADGRMCSWNDPPTHLWCSPKAGRRCGVMLSLFFTAVWSGPASGTDGIEPIGVSVQAQARGGADVAVGDSALSQFDNPATLSLWPRDRYRFDFAGEVLIPRYHWEGRVDSADSEIGLIPLANLAMVLPHNDRLTFGVGVQSKSVLMSRYQLRHILLGVLDRRVNMDMRDISIPFNLAYRLTDTLSIGGGVRGEFATTEFSTVQGSADVEFGRGYSAGAGYQVGLHYRPLPNLAFGLGYRSPTWFGDLSSGDTDALFVGDAETELFGFVPVRLGPARMESLRLPQRVAAGAAWDATDWLKLVGEVRWLNYSNSTLHEAVLQTGRLIDLQIRSPVGYEDQWAFMTGGEFKLDEHWRLGVGYHYATNPIDGARMLPIAAVIAQHHITAGLRYEKDNWWVGGGYTYAPRTSMNGTGWSEIPLGIDYGRRSTIEQSQHSIGIGFGFSW